jgi:glycosyltransferase involved in cell wall biosynthesis
MSNKQSDPTSVKLLVVALQRTGAGPRDALEFSNALCELKTAHEIIISDGNELKGEYVDNEYRKVKSIPTFSSSPASFLFFSLTLFRPLRLLFLILSYVRCHVSSVVFSSHFHPWLILVPIARFFKKVEWYHAVHENPFDTKESRSAILQKLEQFCFNHANRIVCYSEYMRSALSDPNYSLQPTPYNLPSSLPQTNQATNQPSSSSSHPHLKANSYKLKAPLVLPLGSYTSALKGVTPSTAHKRADRLLVGCLGRIEPYKDIDTLLKAFEILQSKNLPVDLLIAGRGPLPNVNAFSSPTTNYSLLTTHYFLENRWLSSDSLTAMALECDVIVVPYKKASQSGIISLAMACGKPVIATNVGGLAEQIEDGSTGIVVSPNDPQALASAIELFILDPKKCETMGMSARALGSGRLSWKRSAEEFLEEAMEDDRGIRGR